MKKNKKNAFTLIELLAVIVILAIIALIATPIILGIVEDARRDSFMRSVELVVSATDIDIFGKDFNNTYTYTINDGVVSNLEVGVKNTDGMNGTITYDVNGNDTYAIHNGKYCVIKTEGMKKAEIKDYVEGECELTVATDASYFTYVDILTDFRIVDTDACIDFMVDEIGYDEEFATSSCNNEPNSYAGMTLIEHANAYPLNYDVQRLIKAEILEGTLTNTIAIAGYSSEGPKDVIIPSKIDGKIVTIIGEAAFYELDLTSVVIPNTVTYIGENAFEFNSLQEVIIPESVTYIEHDAFAYNELQTIKIPSSVEYIRSYAFLNNLLQTVITENDDIEIEDYAFCANPIQENVNSESYQKIYSINQNALSCPPPVPDPC